MNSVIRVSVVTLYNQLWDKQPCLLVFERQKAKPRCTIPGWCLGFVFPHYRSQIMNMAWQVYCTHSMYICCLVNSWPNYMQNVPFKPEKLPQRLQTLLTGHEKTLTEVNGTSFPYTERSRILKTELDHVCHLCNTFTFQIHEVHTFNMGYRTLQYIQISGNGTK